jgi:hypothetical protein
VTNVDSYIKSRKRNTKEDVDIKMKKYDEMQKETDREEERREREHGKIQ